MSRTNWEARYRKAALSDNYSELFTKFMQSSVMRPAHDPRRAAWKEYVNTPLKNGNVAGTEFWSQPEKIDVDKLDHSALMRVCDKHSDLLSKATNGDSRSGTSYFWPVANILSEIKDYHQTQFQPQLGEGLFEPPTHREQNTRRRRG